MQILITIIVLLLVVIILSKAGVDGGIIGAIIPVIISLVAGGGTATVISCVATPYVGVPVGTIVFFLLLGKILTRR